MPVYKITVPEEVINKSRQRLDTVQNFQETDRLPLFYFVDSEVKPVWEEKFGADKSFDSLYDNWKLDVSVNEIETEVQENIKRIEFNYNSFPDGDHVPVMVIRNFQELLLTAIGLPFEFVNNKIELNWVKNPLAEDLKKYISNLKYPDFYANPLTAQTLKRCKYYTELTDHKIPVANIDNQSPLSFASKMMSTTELMINLYDYPDEMRILFDYLADVIILFAKEMQKAAGDEKLFGVGLTKTGSKGYLADDLISFMSPDIFLEVVAPANAKVFNALGGGLIHTCGPTTGRIVESVLGQDGCTLLHTGFIGNEKTRNADEVTDLKNRLYGKKPFYCDPPIDIENFTVDYIKRLYDGGGYFMVGSGSVENGLKLLDIINKAAG